MIPTQVDASPVAEPGQQLRRIRERLRLKYRDVEEASAQIAILRQDDQFQVGLSRLADIENRGTVPSIYRLYSLCVIYRLDFHSVLSWYGVDLNRFTSDMAKIQLDTTNLLELPPPCSEPTVPFLRDNSTDLNRTLYLTRHVLQWGRLPVAMLDGLNFERNRYAFIGLNDWFMYPLIRPGSFVQIDETKRKVAAGGWTNEWDRPIYLIEQREGYRCAWCSLQGDTLILQPHPASQTQAESYRYPESVDVVGQVVAVAMRLDRAMKHHTRFAADLE